MDTLTNIKNFFSSEESINSNDFIEDIIDTNIHRGLIGISMVLIISFIVVGIYFIDPNIFGFPDTEVSLSFLIWSCAIIIQLTIIIIVMLLLRRNISAKYKYGMFVSNLIVFSLVFTSSYLAAYHKMSTFSVSLYISTMFFTSIIKFIKPIYSFGIYILCFTFCFFISANYQTNNELLIQSFLSVSLSVLMAIIISSILFKNKVSDYNNKLELLMLNDELNDINTKLKKANEKLEMASETDFLTSLPNRRKLDNYLKEEWDIAIEKQTSISVCILDVDFFKGYNDFHGHMQGDECLKEISFVLRNTMKNKYGCVARFGGEEFIVIVPNSNKREMNFVCEKIFMALKAERIPHGKSVASEFVTFSGGIASVVPSRSMVLLDFIKMADKALYRAKKSGRNRLETYEFD